MATKTINTKIKLRYATLEEWTSVDPTLLKGEMAVVEIPNVVDGIVQAPSILFKVGTGDKKFSELDYAFAKSADIHSFLKVTEDEFKVWVNTVTADSYDASGAAAKVEEALNAYIESNDAAVKKVSDDLAALDTYVGDIPEGYTEETIIAYINKKAEETLTSATGGSSESAASVLAALNTYKSENDPKVTANTEAIAAIKDGENLDSFKDVETELAKYQLAGNYSVEGHVHAIADVTGLQDALDGKEAAGEAAKVQTALDEYKTSNDAALALKASQADLEAEAATARAAEKANADAITAIKDGAELDSFLDVENALAANKTASDEADTQVLADAKAYADGKDAAIAEAKKAGTDAQANLDTFKTTVAETYETKADATAKLTEAKEYTDTEVAKVQEEVDNLEVLVGTLPEGTDATTIVEYVNAKTSGIATDAALSELQSAVDVVEADVEAIKADYLVEADKTELQGNIDAVSAKVTTLIGDDVDKSVRTIANEELAKQLITEDAAENLNSLEEIAAWIQSHPEDASAMNAAIVALQNQLVGIDAGEGTVKKYVDDAITALNIGQYALAADLTSLAGRVSALETAKEEHAELLAGLRTDVDLKASQADLTSLTTRMDTAEGEIDALQTAIETKANDADLAAIAKTGNVNDLVQTDGDVLVFDCGSAE